MMGSLMVSQGVGPPDGKLAPSEIVAGVSRILRITMGWLTVAKGQTWQLALAIMVVLLASTAAYNEEHSTASYQMVPGTSPDYSESLPFQNSTERLLQAEQDLQNPSTESWPDSHSVEANLYTRNLSASSVGTVGQSHIASTWWNLNKVSGSLELKRDGQGPLSGDSLDLQNSTGLIVATSPSADTLAATTGLSPKLSSEVLQQLETDSLHSSLPLQAVDTEMKQTHTISMHFQTSPPSVTSSSLHLSWNMTHQAAAALNTVPATDRPPSATVLTLGKSSPSEHIAGIVQGVHGTPLSSAKTVHGIDTDWLHGDHNGTVPSTETPGYWDKLKKLPPLQSSGHTDAVGASSTDFSSVMRTTVAGTTDKRMKHFTSGPGAIAHNYFVSMLNPYVSILSVPPTQFLDASSETASSQQISGFNGQEFGVTEPDTREPLSQSSIWHSSSQSEAPTLVAFVKSPGFTDPRKTKESTTHWLLESLSVAKSSRHTPVPVTKFPEVSSASAVNRSHTSAETYIDASLRSVSHYGDSLTTGPSSHVLSVDAPVSSSSWLAVSESALHDSQWSETTSGLPFRNASLSVILHSPKASTDMAGGQLALDTATYVPHSFSTGMPGFGASATTVLELDTGAFGTPTEANLFVGHLSSISEQTANADLTSLSMPSSYLGSAKEQEDAPATETIHSTFITERSKPELKEGSHLVPEEYAGPSEASTQVAFSSDPDGVSFLSMQTSSHPTLYTGETEDLHSWTPSAELETSPSEGMAITAHHSEWTKIELHERGEQTLAAAKITPTAFSELPLIASDRTPVTKLFSLASEKPEVQTTHMYDTLPRQGNEAKQLPPPDSTHLAVSEQPFELKVSSVTKKSGSDTVHTPTPGSPALPSYPYMAEAETMTLVEITPDITGHGGLVTGGSTDHNMTPSERIVAIPTQSYVTAAPASVTEAGRSSVAPTHRSVSPGFMSSDSNRANVSEPTTEATKGLMTKMVPTSTMLSGSSNTEVQRPDLRALTATSTTYKLFLSTGALKAVASTSTMMMEAALDYKATSIFTDAISTTTALPALATAQAIPMSTIASPGALSSASKSKSSPIPASITPPQSTSTWLSTSEPFLARKSLITTLGSMDTKKNTNVSSTKVPSPKETNTTVLISSTKVTEDVHTSKRLVPKFIQSTETDYLTLSSPTSHAIVVRTLPLKFRLTGIDYTESLENKSSNSYKKLEKEVRLTLNKMLSSYGNFLHSNVLNFLNGSVVVESEAVFLGGGFIPTPSDVIRTLVTEIEKRRMDTFFDWRVDLKSLESNGFSLENLEPEVLTVSFTFLGSTATFGGMTDRESLERLRSEVILLLRSQYQVQDFVLDQVGNNQGDLDITGEAYINTSIHVDISWVLEALRGLVNYSVDLSSLSVNGSRLGLQVFPFSFLVTNREVNKELLDRSSLQHKTLARDLSDVLMHILRQYKNFLQVKIREITGGSLTCHGDVIFQHPAPSSKDVLKTLALAIGPKDYLAASSLQVDRFSFTVAGDGLEPPFTRLGVPGYGVALIVMCALAIIAIPVLKLLPKILGRKDKITITRAGDLEAGVETFELDNPGFHSTVEEDDQHNTCPERL